MATTLQDHLDALTSARADLTRIKDDAENRIAHLDTQIAVLTELVDAEKASTVSPTVPPVVDGGAYFSGVQTAPASPEPASAPADPGVNPGPADGGIHPGETPSVIAGVPAGETITVVAQAPTDVPQPEQAQQAQGQAEAPADVPPATIGTDPLTGNVIPNPAVVGNV